MREVLVIEDNLIEAINAQTELARAGIEDFRSVTTLSEGLEAMSHFDGVLSDLFFPVGNASDEQYIQRFLPLYEQFKSQRFKKRPSDDVILRAVKACAKAFEVTPEEYVENVMAMLNTPPVLLKAARDAIAGVDDSERYNQFLKIEECVRNGTNLPLGIVALERAKELGIPSVVVTSTYHHDDAFEAVKGLIDVPYRDTLIECQKDWKGGIELLLKSGDFGGKK